ncbi:undecaprenyl diphosphate synthase family protein [Actinacidiphila sp. SB3-2]
MARPRTPRGHPCLTTSSPWRFTGAVRAQALAGGVVTAAEQTRSRVSVPHRRPPPGASQTPSTSSPSVHTSPTPRHVGVILDGNRRWARSHHAPLEKAYCEGAARVREFADRCAQTGITVVTVWALSRDSLRRAPHTVAPILGAVTAGPGRGRGHGAMAHPPHRRTGPPPRRPPRSVACAHTAPHP